MKPGDAKRRRVLSQEERVLWTAVTKSIAPLREASTAEENDAAEPAPLAPTKMRAARAAPTVPPMPEKKSPPLLTPLGRRMRARVARGKEPIDGRIDLHGLTQSEAHAALLGFLRSANAREARLVLVITGKGRRGEGESGVLKRQVPQWLALPEFRDLVVGLEDAHVSHGGEGALYVRVRRNKRT
jgi:DNA-nicking Smr family endonuclease